MSETTKPEGVAGTCVMPHLVFRDSTKAIAFYKEAFGATEMCLMHCPQTGKVMHAAIQLGSSMLMLCDEFPDYGGSPSAETLGNSPVTLHLHVPDVDATVAKAVEAGAKVTMPVADMFWGDRYGKLTDPFGHLWSVATTIEKVTPEQIKERVAGFATAEA